MSVYTLQITQFGHSGAEGAFDSVFIKADGHFQKGCCTAHLALEGHDGRPHCCTVAVPPCDLVDRAPLAHFADHNHLTSREGVRYYTFATRQEALAFLGSLYGIGAPQPAPESADAPTVADSPAPAQQTTVSPRRVPAPLARDVVPRPVPIAPGRPTGPLFFGNPAYPHPHQRNTQ